MDEFRKELKNDYGLNDVQIDYMFGYETDRVRTRPTSKCGYARSPREVRNYESLIEPEYERVW